MQDLIKIFTHSIGGHKVNARDVRETKQELLNERYEFYFNKESK